MARTLEHLKSMETHKPLAAMLLVQIIYAGMALFTKAAISGEEGMNPYVFVTYRQAFATVALAPFALFIESEKAVPLSSKVLLKIFLISFFGLTLSLNLYSIAINYTTATFAAATTNVVPALTFTLALLMRMERLSIRKVHGIAKVVGSMVGVSGAIVFAIVKGPAILNKPELSNHDQHGCCPDWIKGSLTMISSNILWSLWIVLQGVLVKEYPAKVRLATLQCAFSCIQSAVAAAVLIKKDVSAWKLGWNVHLYSVAYCGVMVTALTYWLRLWAIQRKGPVFTAIFTPLALIITAIFSSLVWHEVLYTGSVGGTVLLVAGLYLVLWGKNKEERFDSKIVSSDEQDEEEKTAANHSHEIIAESKERNINSRESNTTDQ